MNLATSTIDPIGNISAIIDGTTSENTTLIDGNTIIGNNPYSNVTINTTGSSPWSTNYPYYSDTQLRNTEYKIQFCEEKHPRDDIITLDKERIIRIAVPGFEKKDINIQIESKYIEIHLHKDKTKDKLIGEDFVVYANYKIPSDDETIRIDDLKDWDPYSVTSTLKNGIISLRLKALKFEDTQLIDMESTELLETNL